MIFLQEFRNSKTLHYFFYQVSRELSHRSNSFLFEAGLFTSTHSFTVSLGRFVDPEEEDMIWKMGDGLSQTPQLFQNLSTAYEKKAKREVIRRRWKTDFISTAFHLCKAPAKSL